MFGLAKLLRQNRKKEGDGLGATVRSYRYRTILLGLRSHFTSTPFSLPSALVGVASGGEPGRSRRRLNRSIRSGARSRGARDGRQFRDRLAHGRLREELTTPTI